MEKIDLAKVVLDIMQKRDYKPKRKKVTFLDDLKIYQINKGPEIEFHTVGYKGNIWGFRKKRHRHVKLELMAGYGIGSYHKKEKIVSKEKSRLGGFIDFLDASAVALRFYSSKYKDPNNHIFVSSNGSFSVDIEKEDGLKEFEKIISDVPSKENILIGADRSMNNRIICCGTNLASEVQLQLVHYAAAIYIKSFEVNNSEPYFSFRRKVSRKDLV